MPHLHFTVVQDLVAGQHIGHTRDGLAPFTDGSKELSVLKFNTVQAHRHFRDIDLLLFAVVQIIVLGQIGARVPNVTKPGTQGAIVVKRQRQCANGTIGCFELNAHVHGNTQGGVDWALHSMGFDHWAATLISEQINRMCRMVPQQVIGPTSGLAQGVHVGAAKKVSLHIHLLNVELTGLDLLVNPLVRRVKATGVTGHGDQTGGLLQGHNGLCF